MADHGTRSCYARGCRLPECVEANADYQRSYRASESFRSRREGYRQAARRRYAQAKRDVAAMESD